MGSPDATQQSLQIAMRRHEGLSREELEREERIGRMHELGTRDRRGVVALLVFFGAIFAIALAMMLLARSPQIEVAAKNSHDLIEALLPSVE